MRQRIKYRKQKEQSVCRKSAAVFSGVARDELYLGMRFLDVALSSFSYQMDGHGPMDLERMEE